jgi:hypothetical protein
MWRLPLWELDLNSCADPFSRTDRDTASHTLDELSANGQPQTEAFGAALPSIKALEDVGKVIRAYPSSLIFYSNSASAYAKPYICTPTRVFYGVAE